MSSEPTTPTLRRNGPPNTPGAVSFSRRATAVALVLGSAWTASVARADTASDAKVLFARGRALRGAGDCAGAVPVFQQAYALYPAALGSLRNIAECDEALGDREAARRAWLDLGRALAVHPEAKYAGWSEDASQAAQRLAPPAEVEKPPVVGVADPQAEAHPAPPMATSETPAPEPGSDGGRATRRTVGWVGVGVGAAALVGAGIGWWVRQSAIDDLEHECVYVNGQPTMCSPAAHSTESRGSAATTVGDVLAVVGVVGVASGVVLLLAGPASSKHVAVGVSPAGVWATGRF
jgi:hypothetical protein